MPVDPASYRDPAGHVFSVDDKIYRTITPRGLADFTAVRGNVALSEMVNAGWVIDSVEVDPDVLRQDAPEGGLVVEHPRVPFISYPYEWTFGALKAAALLHLDIQIKLLEHDVVLSDASAYNIQFVGTRPLFIDALSFRPYVDGEHWLAHRQFCEQFLNPLLLYAKLGIPFNAWYRGSLEGIPADQLSSALNLQDKLSLRALSHITLPARLQSGAGSSVQAAAKAKERGLPRARYAAILVQLRDWISSLSPKGTNDTTWRNYAHQNTYDDAEEAAKHAFVSKFVSERKPKMTLDLGCNTGAYSDTALKAGAEYAIGLDADHGALEAGFHQHSNDKTYLPLYQDAANPSPGIGWHNQERRPLAARCGDVDAVFALAFEHHLAIAKNVPFDHFVDWIMDFAPEGIIEFVPKNDPTVQQMLALRDDIFDHYTEEKFMEAIKKRATIVNTQKVTQSDRVLIQFARK